MAAIVGAIFGTAHYAIAVSGQQFTSHQADFLQLRQDTMNGLSPIDVRPDKVKQRLDYVDKRLLNTQNGLDGERHPEQLKQTDFAP